MKFQKTMIDRLHRMYLLPLLWLRRALSLLPVPLSFLLLVPLFLHAQEGNPRHPGIVGFEKIARLPSTPGTLWPLGDINGDSVDDFATERYLDTCWSWRCAQEIRIHYGVKGRLPNLEEGFRLAPDELMSKTIFLAAGDWDNDSDQDICVRSQLYNDTSFGNKGLDITHCVIYWGGENGYSTDDTTWLYGASQAWFGPNYGVSSDFDGDGVDDLWVHNTWGKGFSDGEVVDVPRMFLYKGGESERWGRKGKSNRAIISWWNAPENISRLEAQDLDHDGAQDLILYNGDRSSERPLTVLYGRLDGELPDTISDMQQININGLVSDFSDVTGDSYADLIILDASNDLVYIYASTPSARRLEEMFGTGNDPPREGEWWSRPWAALKGPRLVNKYWFGLEARLYSYGSADTSCPDELWLFSWPYVLVYQTGTRLDSLIDAELDIREVAGGGAFRKIGDIDGDGRDEVALIGDGEMAFYRLPDALPRPVRRLRRVPDGTGKPTSGVEESTGRESKTLGVEVVPNPSSGEVAIEWGVGSHGGATSQQLTIRITDILGQEVLSTEIPVDYGRFVWNASDLPNGAYYIILRVDEVTETEHIRIQQ